MSQDMKNLDAAVEGIKALKGKAWRSQAQLSEMAEVAQPQISRLLMKKGTIHFDAACRLLDALGAWIVFPGTKLSGLPQAQELDPLSTKVQTIVDTLRSSGVAEMEILRAVRSMLDAEIEKAGASPYRTGESATSFGTAAEGKEEYGKR